MALQSGCNRPLYYADHLCIMRSLAPIRSAAPEACQFKAPHDTNTRTISPQPIGRRMAGAGLLSLLLFTSPAGPAVARDPTPYERSFNLEYGLDPSGRIRDCPTDAQPNCISTSSLNDARATPWGAGLESDPSRAADEVEQALLRVDPSAELVDFAVTPSGGVYKRFRVKDPAFDHDDVE
jgi:hypothetical protein